MKIQCDVCEKQEASVFCTADEAALCDSCDHRVHHANKLASKHQRFSLLIPSAKQFPLCDVCQERRAFLFCQQDREILCKECDVPIHTANEHTQKHNRYLLTGLKLSAVPAVYTPSSSSNTANTSFVGDSVPDHKQHPPIRNTIFASAVISNPPSMVKSHSSAAPSTTTIKKGGGNLATVEGDASTSGVMGCPMEAIVGWQFEDLFDSSSSPFGFCKTDDDGAMLSLLDSELESSLSTLASESLGIWVPQAPIPQPVDWQIGLKEIKDAANVRPGRVGFTEDGFMVPQIITPSVLSRRSRHFWQDKTRVFW